jgi:hypothetical protein
MRILVFQSDAFDWQRPAITELHALNKLLELNLHRSDTSYIGFPWATLFDCRAHNTSRLPYFFDELARLRNISSMYKKKITVCQHIGMLQHQEFFSGLGITDIFWSHKTLGLDVCPSDSRIRIHSFPLFPVEYEKDFDGENKKYLYSFVGARNRSHYLTDIRSLISDILGQDTSGFIMLRDTWHFERWVYEYQIKKNVCCEEARIDRNAAALFRALLKSSIFSLCPSGAGPNSIRLWESIAAGVIPVILSDTYEPPGNPLVWEAAAVFCRETAEAVRTLPFRLAAMAADKQLIAKKRRALKQLTTLYGPDVFVIDIKKLVLQE